MSKYTKAKIIVTSVGDMSVGICESSSEILLDVNWSELDTNEKKEIEKMLVDCFNAIHDNGSTYIESIDEVEECQQ